MNHIEDSDVQYTTTLIYQLLASDVGLSLNR